MPDLAGLAEVAKDIGHRRAPAEPLVELSDGQQAGVGADEPALKIRDDGLPRVEVEGKLFSTVCHPKASLPCVLQDLITRILQGFGGLCYAQMLSNRE